MGEADPRTSALIPAEATDVISHSKIKAETSDGIKELLSTDKVRKSAFVRVCVCVFSQ